MSPRDKFDRFMADVRNGTNFKIAPLSHAHYRAFFSAVLPIAAMSKVRGAFMVNGEPATAEHMRLMAPTLTAAECRSALTAFRAAGLLEHDEDLGGEWVHDFEEWNPEPKRDTTNADRQARYRDRMKARSNGVTNGVTNAKSPVSNALAREEVEVEVPPVVPQGTSPDLEEWLLTYEQTTGHSLPARTTKAFKSIAESYNARRSEGHAAHDLLLAIAGAHGDTYRRENGYDTAESILRPTKIGKLIAQGRLRRGRTPKTSLELAREIHGGAA